MKNKKLWKGFTYYGNIQTSDGAYRHYVIWCRMVLGIEPATQNMYETAARFA
jgi:hypothetical protein